MDKVATDLLFQVQKREMLELETGGFNWHEPAVGA